MKVGFLMSIKRMNKYLSVLNKCLKVKIAWLLENLVFTEKERKQIAIYLNICHNKNDNLFKNALSKLQSNLISIFLNCVQTFHDKEQDILNENYTNYLEKIEKVEKEGVYLEIANLLKTVHKYNDIMSNFCNTLFRHDNTEFKFIYEIIESDDIFITIIDV